MNCIKCGMEIPDGARFCNFCGVKQELTCASCGAVLPNDARFCHVCGSPVQSETNPEPPSDPYADLDPYAGLDEQEPVPKEEAVSEESEDPGEWDDFGDWDDEESEEPEEAAAEDLFDDALFDELAEEPVEDEKPELILPNEQNFHKQFQIIGRESHAHKGYQDEWELKIQLRWNDTYWENTDADYRCYGCFSIIRKDPSHYYGHDDEHGYYATKYQYGGYDKRVRSVPAFHGLEDLMAYALSDSGIYYVTKDGKICFLDSEDGTTQVLGTQEKVISLKYDAGVLTVIYVKNRRQTGYNEHRDECGGYTEAWYNIFELDVGEFDIQHPDDWLLD